MHSASKCRRCGSMGIGRTQTKHMAYHQLPSHPDHSVAHVWLKHQASVANNCSVAFVLELSGSRSRMARHVTLYEYINLSFPEDSSCRKSLLYVDDHYDYVMLLRLR